MIKGQLKQIQGTKYRCPNCNRESIHEEEQALIVCGCGYEMIPVRRKEEMQ